MQTTSEDLTTLTIARLADRIWQDWPKVREEGTPTGFGNVGQHPANSYWDKMKDFHVIDPKDASYGYDDGKSIVMYFLSNATAWRGDTARAIKAELKRRLK